MPAEQATNPYRPGAGVPPPVLTGRDDVLDVVDRTLAEVAAGGEGQRPWAVTGARGIGKTVLLLETLQRAADAGWTTAHVEAGPPDSLAAAFARALYIPLRHAASRAGPRESGRAGEALRRALRAFSAFKVTVDTAGKLSLGVDIAPEHPQDRTADPGEDLHRLLLAVGQWARVEGSPVLITVDELDRATPADLAALNKALHLLGQEDLPVPLQVVAAGQPGLPGLLARVTPYAERLWVFRTIGALEAAAAGRALTAPADHLGVAWAPAAVARAVAASRGVPYFLQSIGRFAWELRRGGRITAADADDAVELAFADAQGMFLARWDQATPAQQAFMAALAALGGEAAVAQVAERLGRTSAGLGRVRADLLARGVLESPARGRVRFTLPGFARFVASR